MIWADFLHADSVVISDVIAFGLVRCADLILQLWPSNTKGLWVLQ